MSLHPGFPEIWFISLSVKGAPDLLTSPRYAHIIASRLNTSQRRQQVLLRDHVLLPCGLQLLVQPLESSLDNWMNDFIKDTAQDICVQLAADRQPERREYFERMLQPAASGHDPLFWRKADQQQVTSRKQYEQYEKELLVIPVRRGYVSDPACYPYTSFNNRAGIVSSPLDLE